MARPCGGPCDLGLSELLGYVPLLLIAIAVVWATYLVTQRLTRSSERRTSIVASVVAVVAVLVSVPLTLFAVQEIERHVWPTVVVSHRGTDMRDPIYLRGTYGVEWTAIGADTACRLTATLRGANGESYAQPLVDENIPIRTNTGGPTTFIAVDRAAYFIDTASDCPSWSIILTPRR